MLRACPTNFYLHSPPNQLPSARLLHIRGFNILTAAMRLSLQEPILKPPPPTRKKKKFSAGRGARRMHHPRLLIVLLAQLALVGFKAANLRGRGTGHTACSGPGHLLCYSINRAKTVVDTAVAASPRWPKQRDKVKNFERCFRIIRLRVGLVDSTSTLPWCYGSNGLGESWSGTEQVMYEIHAARLRRAQRCPGVAQSECPIMSTGSWEGPVHIGLRWNPLASRSGGEAQTR